MTRPQFTPEQAQRIVDQRIEQFGLGVLPRTEVRATGDGRWRIRWDDQERITDAMTEAQWRDWFERNVGSLKAERLQTTEG
jgi:hypothetical protein